MVKRLVLESTVSLLLSGMSNNSIELKNADVVAAGGGWEAKATNTTTLGSTNGLTYRFETFSNMPKLVRLTIIGTLLITATASGVVSYGLTIPPSILPSWAQPSLGTSGTSIYPSIGVGYPHVTTNIAGYVGDGGNGLDLRIGNSFTGTILSPTSPINWMLGYVAK